MVRFILDTCGTLIDLDTHTCYDYISEILDLINDLDEENIKLKSELEDLRLEKEFNNWRSIE